MLLAAYLRAKHVHNMCMSLIPAVINFTVRAVCIKQGCQHAFLK